MRTFQKLIVGICLMAIPFLNACKDDEPKTCNFATEVQDEVNNISVAATAYANNQSTENCNAYRAAIQAYIDVLEDHRSCAAAAGQTAAFEDAIAGANASLSALQC